jgi:hypothetical protein
MDQRARKYDPSGGNIVRHLWHGLPRWEVKFEKLIYFSRSVHINRAEMVKISG